MEFTKPLRVGVAGNISQMDATVVWQLLDRVFGYVQNEFQDRPIMIVSFGSDQGLSGAAYSYAAHEGWDTCAIVRKGQPVVEHSFPVTQTEEIDGAVIEAGEYFIKSCDALVCVGHLADIRGLISRFDKRKPVYVPESW